MRLYHGSNVKIDTIEPLRGKKGKDFGRGFYLSAIFEQAYRMAELTVAKTGEGEPVVTEFEFDESKVDGLRVKRFEAYDKDWAEFIIMNRNNRSEKQAHDYDIVYGPIADDTVGATISLFQRHYISLDELIKRLQFVKPKYQYFFASESAISALKKIE